MMETGYRKFPRQEVLYPLFRGVDTLKGIGGRLSKIIGKRIGDYVIDLTRHAPHSLIRRHLRENLAVIKDGEVITLLLTPTRHDKPGKNSRRPTRVFCEHANGVVELVFFHAKGDYLARALPLNQPRYVSGRAEWYQQKLQIAHPDYITATLEEIPKNEPIYALTAGLTAKPLNKAIAAALDLVPSLPEWIDADIKTRFGWEDWDVATRALHRPTQEAELHPEHPIRMRLAYDELLANQLALAMVRVSSTQGKGRVFAGTGELRRQLLDSLPFALTQAQTRVIDEISADQTTEKRMLRLLQGDVGSGKTLVAVMAMLNVVESSAQAAIIAPTEILARQHHDSISKMLEPLGIKPCLLVGRMKAKESREAHSAIADGTARVIIGTHALIAEKTQFKDLGLVVIDEQHRFGVRQRLILGDKGSAVDVLAMTATPIPRSLAMTAYGDLDNSILDEKPAGRAPIITTAMPIARMDDVVARLRQTASPTQKVYWVCPLIEESDKIDVAAAEARFTELSASLPALNPRLLHGRMKSDAREDAMQAFRQGDTHLLVATSLIEVGVDIPEASIMIIESAERFGLAQLHQLRGRVGRGNVERGGAQSSCVLLYRAPLGEVARARLAIMRESNDGFRIATEDMRLRGPGEVLGEKQSGDPEFMLANLAYHEDLLSLAHNQAHDIIKNDSTLTAEQHQAQRILMALFERDRAVAYLAGG